MVRYNVRCCCEGTRILGTLDLNGSGEERRVYRKINPATFLKNPLDNDPMGSCNVPFEIVKLKYFNVSFAKDELAVYSEDRPIEFWRELQGFIERK